MPLAINDVDCRVWIVESVRIALASMLVRKTEDECVCPSVRLFLSMAANPMRDSVKVS